MAVILYSKCAEAVQRHKQAVTKPPLLCVEVRQSS